MAQFSFLFFLWTFIFTANAQAETVKQENKQAQKQISKEKITLEKFSISTNEAGRMGVTSVNGIIIVPFE